MKKRVISFILSVLMIVSSVPAFAISASAATAYENELKAKGFTDSYVSKLSALHNKYPNWNFEPMVTNLNWNDVIAGERSSHKKQNIELQSSLPNGFYCNCSSCYKNGNYVITEAGTWVAASKSAVCYYVDPRNWLTEQYIFQFEKNEYSSSQTQSAVEAILKGTWMYDSYITYLNTSGVKKTFTENGEKKKYSKSIMEAAKNSGLSAYYLASKIRQENGGSTNSAYAVRGDISPFQGIYNYYNIGAYAGAKDGLAWAAGFLMLEDHESAPFYSDFDSTKKVPTGTKSTIKKGQRMTYISAHTDKDGVKYYKVRLYSGDGGNSYSGGTKIGYVKRDLLRLKYYWGTYNRPWLEPNRSIIYGAVWIANNYKYQNTGYLQKFNVNSKSGELYSHEYMANVQGAASEASISYTAYKNAGILSKARTFYIPIFKNMPSSPSPRPTTVSMPSSSTTTTTTADATKVTGLTLTSRSTTSLSFKWNAVKNATKYYIYIKNETKGTTFDKTVTSTSATLSGLTTKNKYTVKVRAYVGGSWKSYSSSLTYRTRPPAVTGAKVTGYSATSVSLAWDKMSCDGYKVYKVNSDGSTTWLKTISGSSNNSYKVTGLKSGYAYQFKVLCYYDGVNSSKTGALKSQTKPAKVSGLTLSTNTSHQIVTKWKKPSGSCSGYQVQYSRSSTFSSVIATVTRSGSSTLSYTGKNFTKGVKYYVRVRAYKTINSKKYYGSWSDKASIVSK